jgi:hypothetical protein
MKSSIACVLTLAPFQVMAHDGPLFSAEHADLLGLCLMAIGVLLATIASWGPLIMKGHKANDDAGSETGGTPQAHPVISLVYSRDV